VRRESRQQADAERFQLIDGKRSEEVNPTSSSKSSLGEAVEGCRSVMAKLPEPELREALLERDRFKYANEIKTYIDSLLAMKAA
jgi:hypothetical protein